MDTAAVVGTGLIGTSIALALSARGVTTHLIDRDPDAVRLAAARGAGTPKPPPAPVDIAVIAVPPSHTARTLADHQKAGLARVYTDVASVKALPHAECLALGCDTTTLVGGHPLAGRERSGPLAARADLFQDHHWVLTPTPETGESALNRALELVSLCGAVPVLLEPPDHDRAVALVSHLPHLLASLAAARLRDGEEYAVRLAGRGMRDATRVAAGDAGLWADILAANAGALAPLLTELGADLTTAAHALSRLSAAPEPEATADALADLTALLHRGAEGRARIAPSYDGTGARPHSVLSVALSDRDRPLARLLADVDSAQLQLEGLDLTSTDTSRPASPATPADPPGSVRLKVAPDVARPLAEALRDRGWTVR
ncbi:MULTISPECIES: prephenate dehydrogenase [unclassified Streptomyces]|uniref:prephenate dehydrogenase n=1 Tax=unclassified Streptomyces TaxID=2593676 RepID=UPI00037DFA3D|nr:MULTISPECIES: prephenate dehydrogenase [unclassified Streptomyces]MYT29131.1 prephenate dehydrogenase/arogenate dehydrogenase family protein [Streptomyces sp. SID8354]